jgi:dsRNA-specific ribonuclease
LATGEGWSKKEAEEYAAAKALADQSWIQKDLTLNV